MTLYQVAEDIGAVVHKSPRARMAGVRSTAAHRSSRKTRTGAIPPRSTSTSTATTEPVSGPAIKPAGPELSVPAMHLFATTTSEQMLHAGMRAAAIEMQKPRSDQLTHAV